MSDGRPASGASSIANPAGNPATNSAIIPAASGRTFHTLWSIYINSLSDCVTSSTSILSQIHFPSYLPHSPFRDLNHHLRMSIIDATDHYGYAVDRLRINRVDNERLAVGDAVALEAMAELNARVKALADWLLRVAQGEPVDYDMVKKFTSERPMDAAFEILGWLVQRLLEEGVRERELRPAITSLDRTTGRDDPRYFQSGHALGRQ